MLFQKKKPEIVGKPLRAVWLKNHWSCSCCWNHEGSKELIVASLPPILIYLDFQYQVSLLLSPRQLWQQCLNDHVMKRVLLQESIRFWPWNRNHVFQKKTEVPILFTHLDMEAHVIPELLAWFLAVRSQTAAFREVFCVRKIHGFGSGPAIVVVQSCQKSCLFWITSIWRLISANNYCLNASIEVLISKKVLLQDFWGKNLSFSFWVL